MSMFWVSYKWELWACANDMMEVSSRGAPLAGAFIKVRVKAVAVGANVTASTPHIATKSGSDVVAGS